MVIKTKTKTYAQWDTKTFSMLDKTHAQKYRSYEIVYPK